MVAAALPGLYWEQGPETAPQLKAAGVECIAVPMAKAEAWKRAGFCATAADLSSYEKLAQRGVEYRPDVASASRAPWVISNGWRLLRSGGKPVYYDAAEGRAPLCVAEAFAYGATALVRAVPAELSAAGAMLSFLKRMDAAGMEPRANIGFIDDGSPAAGEVMNLLIRRNLLFRIVPAPDPSLDLNVRLGTPEYPRGAAANPSEFAATIRRKVTDDKRLLRVYGSEVVVARLTADKSRARVQLLNYSGKTIEGLRVRVLGVYKSATISASEAVPDLSDFSAADGATEFSVPALGPYAIVDLR